MTHLCDDCRYQFPTCHARKIVFGIDKDPKLRGAASDAVLECDAYEKRAAPFFKQRDETMIYKPYEAL